MFPLCGVSVSLVLQRDVHSFVNKWEIKPLQCIWLRSRNKDRAPRMPSRSRSRSRSRSYFKTDGHSVNMSWCRAHSGTCDQMLHPIGRLLSESCGLVSVRHPLWRVDGSVVCSAMTQWSGSSRTRNHTLLAEIQRTLVSCSAYPVTVCHAVTSSGLDSIMNKVRLLGSECVVVVCSSFNDAVSNSDYSHYRLMIRQ
jgi:hypothetical protein